jgi:hypothetical protein
VSSPPYVPAGSPLPPLDQTRYEVRPVKFLDTGRRAGIATIDGEPVAMEPTRAALDAYAERYRYALVTHEFMRDVGADADRWRRLPRIVRWVVTRLP